MSKIKHRSVVQFDNNLVASGSSFFFGHVSASSANFGGNVIFAEDIAVSGTLQLQHVSASSARIGESLVVGEELTVSGSLLIGGPYEYPSPDAATKIDKFGTIYAGSNLHVAGDIIHMDDANTFIRFGDDSMSLQAGGVTFIDLTENDSQDILTLGATSDLDVSLKSGDGRLFMEGSSGNVGIGSAVGGASATINRLQINHGGSDGNDGVLIARADTSITDGDLLGGIGFDGGQAGNLPSTITEASAFIAAYAAEDFNIVSKGGYLVFGTSQINDHDDTASNVWMTIQHSGNVGIGNTQPGSLLEITKTAAYSEATRPTIEISSFSDANDLYTSAGVLKFHKSANDTINSYGAGSHTVAGEVIGRIEAWGVTNDDDGSSDAAKLSSYIEFSGDAVADETDVPGKIVFATADADDAGTPTERMRIDDGGNVGIGTNAPGCNLHVAGNDVRIRADGDSNSHPGFELSENGTRKWIIFNNYTNDNLDFKTDSNIRMSIEQDGNVGIGTESPNCKLHVAGAAAFSGPSETFVTFGSSDTTPSVANGNLFKTHASSQTLTMFDDGTAGQIINVISTAAVVYDVTGTNLKGGSTDITTASGDVTTWVFDGTNWYLLNFMDVSADLSGGH
tara:strand:+ start:3167 stop:5035 length:1869 start_codon:yes stop_codon:yes gene_type:complete